MKFLQSTSKYLTATILLLWVCGCASQIPITVDRDFVAFLNRVMQNYTGWLQDNTSEPTEVIPDEIVLQPITGNLVILKCHISNQSLTNHRNGYYETVHSESNFGDHRFASSHLNEHRINFNGDFICNGAINMVGWCEFFGSGTFSLAYRFSEQMAYSNVGVRENMTFNLEQKISNYSIHVMPFDRVSSVFDGDWNAECESQFVHKFIFPFEEMYRKHMQSSPLQPARQLLDKYLLESILNTSFPEIFSSGSFPPAYDPVPIQEDYVNQ